MEKPCLATSGDYKQTNNVSFSFSLDFSISLMCNRFTVFIEPLF